MLVKSILSQKSLVFIFTYAPAGLGHLRVTEALYHGLPKEITPILLGSQDKSISYIHRIMSIHPLARKLMEWGQRGPCEDFLTYFYRLFLRSRTRILHEQLLTILDQRINLAKTVLIIATHFGLAHQLAALKKKITEERKVKIILVIQVTDDSPQHIWYIPGADLIFVPSQKTKDSLLAYSRRANLEQVKIEVNAYPISPLLAEKLSDHRLEDKKLQTDFTSKAQIQVMIPISGAAVGTQFYTSVIDALYNQTSRFKFHVVSKSALYTQTFLRQMVERPFVKLHVSTHDRIIVDKYIEVYRDNTILLELTKPSEQTFKTLLTPNQIGGSIILFCEPVGRQEYDNLDFLRRKHLIPSRSDQGYLWQKAERNLPLDKEMLEKATNWRGVELPRIPQEAASFIWWSFTNKLFASMSQYKGEANSDDPVEVSSEGVKSFWLKVNEYLNFLNI